MVWAVVGSGNAIATVIAAMTYRALMIEKFFISKLTEIKVLQPECLMDPQLDIPHFGL